MLMNNLPINGKKKQSAIWKSPKLGNFMLQMDGLKDGRLDSRFFQSYCWRKKTVTPEMTSSLWVTHLPTILSRFELKDIYSAIIYNVKKR